MKTLATGQSAHTAEHVSNGHPDKFCDQVADSILDEVLRLAKPEDKRKIRTAVECLAKDNLLVVSGEIKIPNYVKGGLDVGQLGRNVWKEVGYPAPEALTVIDHLQSQSPDIAMGTDSEGAGDQGIMVGYATSETADFLPLEYVVARDICATLNNLRINAQLPWLRSDCKTQVTLWDATRASSIIVAAQHAAGVSPQEIKASIIKLAIEPIFQKYELSMPSDLDKVLVNGTGQFVIGGTIGDAGVVGRKIVVDAYGPRVPVGGGAYSGKDFTKVDRSAAYMARHLAKSLVASNVLGAKEVTVKIAYCIGQQSPEMISAIGDNQKDLTAIVKAKFPDLSPAFIIDYLGLANPQGWSYFETASFGHYGKSQFPWERIVEL